MKTRILLLFIGILQSCHAAKQMDSLTILSVTSIGIHKHALVFELGQETHDYDFFQFRVDSAKEPAMQEIDLAVPVEGSGIYERATKIERQRINRIRILARNGQRLRLEVRKEVWAKFRKAKEEKSPLAFIYLLDVERISLKK